MDGVQGPELLPDRKGLEALARDPDLAVKVQGIGRGAKVNAACSDGTLHRMEARLQARLGQLERRKRHYQRSAARKTRLNRALADAAMGRAGRPHRRRW